MLVKNHWNFGFQIEACVCWPTLNKHKTRLLEQLFLSVIRNRLLENYLQCFGILKDIDFGTTLLRIFF